MRVTSITDTTSACHFAMKNEHGEARIGQLLSVAMLPGE
jgi:hypothetical protein